MSITSGGLFQGIPQVLPEELTTVMQADTNVRIERIVSAGHKSPADFWYEQEKNEWVVVLEGSAVIEFSEGKKKSLAAGDYINIPKGIRHRVAATDRDKKTIWLAVFY